MAWRGVAWRGVAWGMYVHGLLHDGASVEPNVAIVARQPEEQVQPKEHQQPDLTAGNAWGGEAASAAAAREPPEQAAQTLSEK